MQFDPATAYIMQIVAPLSGFRIHKREWRTSRGASMSTSIDLEKLGRLLDGEVSLYDRRYGSIHCPEFTGIPETDRRTLRDASAGDAKALGKLRKYLEDGLFLERWGNPSIMARVWIISQLAGEDRVVSQATQEHAEQLCRELGFRTCGVLERLGITRIVNNWLVLGMLEARANRFRPGSRERVAFEKTLSQAERRFHLAIRNLAFIRNVRDIDVAQHIANTEDGTGKPT